MYQETSVSKAPAVLEYLSDLLENEETSFIVFAHHISLMDAISNFLGEKGVKHIRIDGSTPQHSRQALVDTFQDKEDVRVAVLGITSASVGLTLTKASTIIFAELYWTPAQLLQGEDRAHRIGQKRSVDVKYLLAEGTVDDQLWPILKRKLEVVGQSVDGAKGVMVTTPAPSATPEIPASSSPPSGAATQRSLVDMFKQQVTKQQQEEEKTEAKASPSPKKRPRQVSPQKSRKGPKVHEEDFRPKSTWVEGLGAFRDQVSDSKLGDAIVIISDSEHENDTSIE